MKTFRLIVMLFLSSTFLMTFAIGSLYSNLRNVNNHADYILITPSSYYDLAEKLAVFRHEKNNFTTMVVNFDTILVQFGMGVSSDTALKNFIQYALKNWSDPKPQYFVLVGNTNTIPSHATLETLAPPDWGRYDTLLMIDQWFIVTPDSSGAQHINACIGRLPAWDYKGLSVMVTKTINYERDTAGEWFDRAICLSDYDSLDRYIFENNSDSIKSLLGSLWPDTVSVDIRSDSPSHLDTMSFLSLWNTGAAIVSYFGHANQDVFSSTHYFSTQNIDFLYNSDRLPICFFGGCDLTFDTRPPLSIPTNLLERDGGGAVAVISSEGLNYEGQTLAFYSSLIKLIMLNPDQLIGKSFKDAKSSFDAQDLAIERYTFLGDPALTVKHSATSTFIAHTRSYPGSFILMQNYPNPFNVTTLIVYQVPIQGIVSLKVYDMLGREVKTLINDQQTAGIHSVLFNATNMASGVYFYRLQANSFSETKKLILLK